MAIPQNFLDDLHDRLNIVEVVSAYVPLSKKGGNYWGLCPFHHEKTPSFSVNEPRQIFHCFGCGKGGSAVRFSVKWGGQVVATRRNKSVAKERLVVETVNEEDVDVSTMLSGPNVAPGQALPNKPAKNEKTIPARKGEKPPVVAEPTDTTAKKTPEKEN